MALSRNWGACEAVYNSNTARASDGLPCIAGKARKCWKSMQERQKNQETLRFNEGSTARAPTSVMGTGIQRIRHVYTGPCTAAHSAKVRGMFSMVVSVNWGFFTRGPWALFNGFGVDMR